MKEYTFEEKMNSWIDTVKKVGDIDMNLWCHHASESIHSCGNYACLAGCLAEDPLFLECGGWRANTNGAPRIAGDSYYSGEDCVFYYLTGVSLEEVFEDDEQENQYAVISHLIMGGVIEGWEEWGMKEGVLALEDLRDNFDTLCEEEALDYFNSLFTEE